MMKTYIIKVGFPKEKQVVYPPKMKEVKGADGKFSRMAVGGGQTVAQVANWNEEGTKMAPSRPFFSTAIHENKDKIKEIIIKAIATPQDTSRFDKVGVAIVNMIKDSIVNGNWTPNAEYTKIEALPPTLRRAWDYSKPNTKAFQKALAAVENKKPLIDRGIMLRSVSYTVTEE